MIGVIVIIIIIIPNPIAWRFHTWHASPFLPSEHEDLRGEWGLGGAGDCLAPTPLHWEDRSGAHRPRAGPHYLLAHPPSTVSAFMYRFSQKWLIDNFAILFYKSGNKYLLLPIMPVPIMKCNGAHRKLGAAQVQVVSEYQLSVADSVVINIQDDNDDPGKNILLSWTHQVSPHPQLLLVIPSPATTTTTTPYCLTHYHSCHTTVLSGHHPHCFLCCSSHVISPYCHHKFPLIYCPAWLLIIGQIEIILPLYCLKYEDGLMVLENLFSVLFLSIMIQGVERERRLNYPQILCRLLIFATSI